MTVTAIMPFDRRRSKIILDERKVLLLYRGEIKRFHIEESTELTEEVYREILEELLCKRARERVLYLLKSSDKTEAQVRRKLREGYYPEEAIDAAVNFVKEYRYIDDDRYARRYLEVNREKKSVRQIVYDLKQKGLSAELIRAVVEERPVAPDEEEEQVRRFLLKKGYRGGECAPREQQRLMSALARKGYSFDTISKVFREFCDNSWEY